MRASRPVRRVPRPASGSFVNGDVAHTLGFSFRHRKMALSLVASIATAVAFPASSTYTWREHTCSYVKAGQGKPVILLHGFAGS